MLRRLCLHQYTSTHCVSASIEMLNRILDWFVKHLEVEIDSLKGNNVTHVVKVMNATYWSVMLCNVRHQMKIHGKLLCYNVRYIQFPSQSKFRFAQQKYIPFPYVDISLIAEHIVSLNGKWQTKMFRINVDKRSFMVYKIIFGIIGRHSYVDVDVATQPLCFFLSKYLPIDTEFMFLQISILFL